MANNNAPPKQATHGSKERPSNEPAPKPIPLQTEGTRLIRPASPPVNHLVENRATLEFPPRKTPHIGTQNPLVHPQLRKLFA